MLMLDPEASKMFQADTGQQLDGVDMKSYVERQGLAIAGVDRQGEPKVDPTIRKLVTEVWPRITGGPIFVRVGAQETPEDEIEWQTPQPFDPTVDEKVDVCVQGKYIGVRFEAEGDSPWELHGYDLEIEPIGRY